MTTRHSDSTASRALMAEVSRGVMSSVGGRVAVHGGWALNESLPGLAALPMVRVVYAVGSERAGGLAAWRDVVELTLGDGTEVVALESAVWARLLQRSHGGVHAWVRGRRHASSAESSVILGRLEALAGRCADAAVAEWWAVVGSSPLELGAQAGFEAPDVLSGTNRLRALDRWVAEARRSAG